MPKVVKYDRANAVAFRVRTVELIILINKLIFINFIKIYS